MNGSMLLYAKTLLQEYHCKYLLGQIIGFMTY